MNLKVLEKLKLYRGATSVIELDFTGFTFENNSYCQLTIKKKYNDDIVFQHDFDKPIKYYVTFKDEFTASLDDDKYKYDIMYMLDDERYPQCLISDIIIDEVVNNYKGEFNAEAVQITEVLEEGAEITQSIKVTTSNVIIASSNLQERTITPTKEKQVILADDGFDGISKVVVEAIPNQYVIPNLQEKEARVTAPTNIFVHPDEEYDGLAFVNVIASVDTETKEVTPSKEVQNISRSDGKYIDSVTVNAIPDNYIEPSGELEITENGSYDVTDKASVKVETSGADLSEYFGDTIEKAGTGTGSLPWVDLVKKLPPITNNGDMAYLFNNFKGTELGLSSLDFTKATTMQGMFYNCSNISNLDLKNFDTSNVTTMASMFNGCQSIETLDVSSFNTKKVKSMSNMFNTFISNIGKSGILKNIIFGENFDTGLVTSMSYMFRDYMGETIDVANFNTENVTNMDYMFYGCKKLKELNINDWDVGKVTAMNSMFNNCSGLTSLDLSKWNTSSLKSIGSTFSQCFELTDLDISGWDFSNVVGANSYGDVSSFFTLCQKLTNLSFGKNLGKGYTTTTANQNYHKLLLSSCKLLTHDSLMSVINGLYDLNLTYDVANGGTLRPQSLVLGADNIAKLSEEELAICTTKGWTVS